MKLNLKEIKKLQQKKYRKELGYVFIEGEHLIQELEKTNFSNVEIICSQSYKNRESKYPVFDISEEQFKKISTVKTAQGIAALVHQDEFLEIEKTKKYLVFESIQDPANLGNIIRQVAWFGDFTVVLSDGSVDRFNDKVIRSSMGGIFHVPVIENANLNEFLSNFNHIAILDLKGNDLKESSFKSSTVFVFGNEAKGLSEKTRTMENVSSYTVSGKKRIESLNLNNVVSIVLYELNR